MSKPAPLTDTAARASAENEAARAPLAALHGRAPQSLHVAAGVRAAAPELSAQVGAAAPLARARAAAAQLWPQVHYRITRLGVAGQTGLAALAAAAVVAMAALIPAHHTLETLNADLARALHPAAIAGVEQAAPRLLASLPTRAQVPGVLGQIFATGKAAGVVIDSGRYLYAPPKRGTIGRYELVFPVKAGYPAIRTFIDRTLTLVPAVAVDKLRVERKAVGDAAVTAEIGFVVFVRAGQQP